jgi:hypothetical protein
MTPKATHYPPPPGDQTGITGTGWGPGEVPYHLPIEDTTDPGIDKKIGEIPAGSEIYLKSLKISCRKSVKYTVKLDGDTIGTGRTSAANPDSFMNWEPSIQKPSSLAIEVYVCANDSQAASDVEAFIAGYQV